MENLLGQREADRTKLAECLLGARQFVNAVTLQMEKPEPREAESLVQGYTVSRAEPGMQSVSH